MLNYYYKTRVILYHPISLGLASTLDRLKWHSALCYICPLVGWMDRFGWMGMEISVWG